MGKYNTMLHSNLTHLILIVFMEYMQTTLLSKCSLIVKVITQVDAHFSLRNYNFPWTKDPVGPTLFATHHVDLLLVWWMLDVFTFLNKAQILAMKCQNMSVCQLDVCMCVWVWTFRPMLLLHVDGNVNLYVNVIQETGYHHQSYLLHAQNSKIVLLGHSFWLWNINIHLFLLSISYIVTIIGKSVYLTRGIIIIVWVNGIVIGNQRLNANWFQVFFHACQRRKGHHRGGLFPYKG